MNNKFKEQGMKNPMYYFFNDMINIKNLDLIKPGQINSHTKCSHLLHWILKINSVNPLYLLTSKINGCIEENNGNKYLMLVPTGESKDIEKV